ncbi:MAG: PH domain-containing protein [Anaerolineales bacterium]|jgi:membrane protein YdbS with pleckstrin-like domain
MEVDSHPVYTFRVHWLKGIFAPSRLIGQKLIVFRTKVILETGIFRKDERVIPISKITDIRVTKGCIAGVMGYGNLYIETAGTATSEITVMDIDSPDYARDLLVHLIDQNE